MLDKPTTIVYLRPDTIGDLILFTPALALFMEEWPAARHVLVVREGYEDLRTLFPPALEWQVTTVNPFKQRPSDCRAELAQLLADLDAMKPNLILAPTLNRTWLELAVAAHFAGVRSVVLGSADVDPLFAASLRLDLGVEPATAFRETVEVNSARGDAANQHRFAEALIGRARLADLPAVTVPPAAAAAARTILSGLGLPPGRWAAVFPGGLANVPVKAWTPAGFGEVVAWLESSAALPCLLLGHVSEADFVQAVADRAAAAGAAPRVWLGRDGELPLLAALLAQAALYVGHDTGAMHLAGAVGRPVVGIFGGGHWPRFRPSARQAVSVVQPLPCFGCNWDCHFGDGPCVKSLAAADVIAGIERVRTAGRAPLDHVIEADRMGPQARWLIAAALPGLRELKRDRVDRQHKIEELKAETDSKDVEILDLKRAAEERKQEMEAIKAELEQECADKDREIAELKMETNSKDAEMAELKAAAEERKEEMEAIKAELEQECADKDREIADLKAEADTKDAEIAALKVSCDEREEIVVRLDAGLRAHIAASAAREQQVAAVEAAKAALAAEIAQLGALPATAATWAEHIGHKDTHIANLEGIIRSRDQQVAELQQAVANYETGHGGIEQAKYYGRLLAGKEAVIQELHRTCVERGAVIEQLAAGATGPAARLRKIGVWLRAAFRAKVGDPLARWAFRAMVENYWMQIGVLRQHEPSPLSWDRRLRGGPTRAPLPRIGIVTPSYGQAAFIESTMLSVLNQDYPDLRYVVQDGGSSDGSTQIIARYGSRLAHWSTEPDRGQADAIRKGFARIEGELAPTDVMAWLNSDDLLAPRSLAYVGAYFAAHPEVDVVYGHRIIIDEHDQEVGRWVMPRHEPDSIEWIDYVPQETLFWRKRAWDVAGGIDPSFQFALDWDLLARFHKADYRITRLPFFLGAFRVHSMQKTSQVIHTTGADEMARIRRRFHGSDQDSAPMIERHARRIRFRGALAARLLGAGVRW